MSQLLQAYHFEPTGSEGSFRFLRLILLIASLFVSSCEKNNSSVIDPLGNPPAILTASISPGVVNLDTVSHSATSIQLIASAHVANQTGSAQFFLVNFSVTDETGIESLATGQLSDNGVFPDQISGDSVFSALISISVQNIVVGKYVCQVVAQSANGLSSNTFLLPIVVGRQLNHSPVLSNLQVPDTVSRSGSTQQLLTVKATDLDGQTDIARVFFKSFKPDGSPTNGGNAILMYDDGGATILFAPDITSEDAVKGDGIYTFPLIVNATTAIGRYQFVFQATDRSNASSDTLRHFIYVKQ